MAFGYNPTYNFTPNGGFAYQPQGNAYASQPTPNYQQPMPQIQQPQQQMGGVSARYVTCREEAVAAQILPDGNVWAFLDMPHGMIYTKQINPQTNMADFREYQMVQPAQNPQSEAAPQEKFASLDAFNLLKNEVESLKTAMAQPVRRTSPTKEVKNNDAI